MTEHDNPDGPSSCGAWHKPGETDTPEQELKESAEQPYPSNNLEKRYAIELLRVRAERNKYLGCLEVILRDLKCPTSRSWHCRNNYQQLPVQDIMRAVEELLATEQNKNRQLRNDLESARRERDTAQSELAAVMSRALMEITDTKFYSPSGRYFKLHSALWSGLDTECESMPEEVTICGSGDMGAGEFAIYSKGKKSSSPEPTLLHVEDRTVMTVEPGVAVKFAEKVVVRRFDAPSEDRPTDKEIAEAVYCADPFKICQWIDRRQGESEENYVKRKTYEAIRMLMLRAGIKDKQ